MKKILLVLFCLSSLVMSGCGLTKDDEARSLQVREQMGRARAKAYGIADPALQKRSLDHLKWADKALSEMCSARVESNKQLLDFAGELAAYAEAIADTGACPPSSSERIQVVNTLTDADLVLSKTSSDRSLLSLAEEALAAWLEASYNDGESEYNKAYWVIALTRSQDLRIILSQK